MSVRSTKVTGPKGEEWYIEYEYVPPLDDESEEDNPSGWVVESWPELASGAWAAYQVWGPGALVFDLPERQLVGGYRNYIAEAAPLARKVMSGDFLKVLQGYDPARQVLIVVATENFYEQRCFISVIPGGNAPLPCEAKAAAADDRETTGLDLAVWGDLLRDLELSHELNPTGDETDED